VARGNGEVSHHIPLSVERQLTMWAVIQQRSNGAGWTRPGQRRPAAAGERSDRRHQHAGSVSMQRRLNTDLLGIIIDTY